MSMFDDQVLDIPCDCGRKTQKSVRWIKANREFTCPCGSIIRLDTDQFRRELAAIDAKIASFERGLFKL